MRTLIILVVGLLAVGCASTPTMESVAGTYELTPPPPNTVDVFDHLAGYRIVFLDNGVLEFYHNGEQIGMRKGNK